MQRQEAVGRHYDELDVFYREVWGEHVHHGLWRSGNESPTQAARALVDRVAREARIGAGDAVCDVGCGYGGTARIFTREYGARLTALTVSPVQLAYARAQADPIDDIDYRLCDWLENDLPANAFDAVIAIESVSHMADRRRFFEEAARVLRPGGRLVACIWLSSDEPARWQQRLLLAPIVREGRIAGLDPASVYLRWMADAGLVPTSFQDLTGQVRRTWTVSLRRLAGKLLTDSRYRRYLFDATKENRAFALAMLRIWWAYQTGAMRYGVFTGRRPRGSSQAR